MTCSFPGCYGRAIVVTVGPDLPSPSGPLDDVPPNASLAYVTALVTALACTDHVDIVKRRLQEEHQPRRSAYREGRP